MRAMRCWTTGRSAKCVAAARPGEGGGDVVGGGLVAVEGGFDRRFALVVMRQQLVDAALQAEEGLAVGGQDQVGVQRGDFAERIEEGAQRIAQAVVPQS